MIKSKWKKKITKALCSTFLLTTIIVQPLSAVNAAKKDDDKEKKYVRKPAKVRIYGNDRYETSSKIAKDGWSSSYYAIIASGENFPDSLSAVTLAKKHDAPILLTNSKSLNTNTREELTRMKVKKVLIIGGQGSISSKVEQDIKSMGITTERLGGRDRYETSIKIAERLGNPGTLFVVTSNHFGDALSVGPIAAKKGAPIILTSKDNLSDYTKKYLYKKVFNKIYIIGDRAQISDKVASEFEKYVKNSQPNENAVERIDTKSNNSSIYERNINVIDKFESDLNSFREIYIASGVAFADALSVNALAAKKGAPIVIGNTSDGNLLKSFISKNYSNISIINIVGGQGVISEAYVNNIVNYIEDEEIKFTDKNMAKAVREKLGITNENQRIYKSTVKNIQTLDLSGFNIENIDGIQLFDGLKELNLSNNKIQDLEPLEDMFYLESLNLSGNKVEDLEPLEELHSLKYLNLSDNNVRHVDSLKKLEYLKYLNLSKNDISYIEDFDKLTYLYYLDLSDNYNIGGLSELSDLKSLTTLKLSHTGISSLSFLEDLKSLTELDLSQNSISSLDDLKKLDNLKTLYLNDNSITYIEDLKDLKSLEELNVWGNDINDVEKFKKFKKLRKLTIERSLLDDDDRKQLDLISNIPHIFDKENTYNKNYDYGDVNSGNITENEYKDKDLKDISDEVEEFKKDNENYKRDYNPYEVIYKSNSTYGGKFTAKELLNREKDFQSMIGNSRYSMETRKMIQKDLEKVINQYGIINKTNRMNDKVMELEAKLNMSFDEKEKRKARNEINYVYSDYKYDFYKNAVAECEDAMSRLKAQIGELEYSNSYSDNEKARILKGELTNKQIEYNVITDNLTKYDKDRSFFAAMNSFLNK
ncbi:MAG: cell wall-binding repeat-containing protein [Clostridium cochlearium]|uniref:cell wall-binding repeat-containing protein n=1 Tax=Clostridium cochlearium TaxID=1494 RepID=UPI00280B8E22|nr:cell wall-binding repeat-containing protein [Clostridium cochlearium]MDU1443491.1 cell wall-binding repeat-containing protein [Clostridium cochlearium]